VPRTTMDRSSPASQDPPNLAWPGFSLS